jgi:hypothetical protein
MLEGIEKVTGVAAAHRCFSITRTILSWQSARDDDFKSPIRRGMWEAPDNQHSRTLTDAELKAVWDAATDRAGASQRWPSSTTCAQRQLRRSGQYSAAIPSWCQPSNRAVTPGALGSSHSSE